MASNIPLMYPMSSKDLDKLCLEKPIVIKLELPTRQGEKVAELLEKLRKEDYDKLDEKSKELKRLEKLFNICKRVSLGQNECDHFWEGKRCFKCELFLYCPAKKCAYCYTPKELINDMNERFVAYFLSNKDNYCKDEHVFAPGTRGGVVCRRCRYCYYPDV